MGKGPPPSRSLPTARTVAAAVLVRVLEDRAFAAAVLDAEVSRATQLEARDRALATELVYGSLRVMAWLDGRIVLHAPRGLSGLDARTHAELLLSTYQLFFLERVPAFAAVNEAVESIKKARGPKLAAFANAVLRKLALESERTKGGNLLSEATLASLPAWLKAALVRALGDDGARAFVDAGLHSPPLGLRVNEEGERDAVLAKLAVDVPRATFEPGQVSPLAILARGGGRSEAWPGEGETWSVQEEGSQVVALALGGHPGETVLDACAGRGNKAAVLARAVRPNGALDVADLHPKKLLRLEAQLSRAGLPPRSVHAVDWSVGPGSVRGPYDAILVDAPCSGVGTLRRRPELALRREPEDLLRLAALQAAIVLRAASCLRPGGRLVYAVCSVLTEESEGVVERVRTTDPTLSLVPFAGAAVRALAGGEPTLHLLPHVHGTDGYFLASFQRG